MPEPAEGAESSADRFLPSTDLSSALARSSAIFSASLLLRLLLSACDENTSRALVSKVFHAKGGVEDEAKAETYQIGFEDARGRFAINRQGALGLGFLGGLDLGKVLLHALELGHDGMIFGVDALKPQIGCGKLVR